jgi:hypothetical protein
MNSTASMTIDNKYISIELMEWTSKLRTSPSALFVVLERQ